MTIENLTKTLLILTDLEIYFKCDKDCVTSFIKLVYKFLRGFLNKVDTGAVSEDVNIIIATTEIDNTTLHRPGNGRETNT